MFAVGEMMGWSGEMEAAQLELREAGVRRQSRSEVDVMPQAPRTSAALHPSRKAPKGDVCDLASQDRPRVGDNRPAMRFLKQKQKHALHVYDPSNISTLCCSKKQNSTAPQRSHNPSSIVLQSYVHVKARRIPHH